MKAKQKPKRIPLDKPTTLRLSPELRSDAERVASKIGVSFSDVVRMATAEFVRRQLASL